MKIAIIDNFDSFTFNLAHYLGYYINTVDVWRNNAVDLRGLEAYDKIILSPGPGLPSEIPFLHDLIQRFSKDKPILGICLGLQAIGEFFGGHLINLPQVLHGKQSKCWFNAEEPLFNGVESPLLVGHYHSWVLEPDQIPDAIKVIARSYDHQIMAIKHLEKPIYGIQFHPESILTPQGLKMIGNWVGL